MYTSAETGQKMGVFTQVVRSVGGLVRCMGGWNSSLGSVGLGRSASGRQHCGQNACMMALGNNVLTKILRPSPGATAPPWVLLKKKGANKT